MSSNTDVQPEKQRELLFEYDQLRKEILENFSLGVQILGGTVTFAAVIMTLGFSGAVQNYSAKAALFFVGESIAFIGMLQTLSLARSTFRIASYLRVFTEKGLDCVRWETRLRTFRLEKPPYKEVTSSVRYTYAFIVIVNFILGSAFALVDAASTSSFRGFRNLREFIWNGVSESPSTGIFISLTFIITFSLLGIAMREYGKFAIQYDDTYMRRWKSVKDSEEKTDDNDS